MTQVLTVSEAARECGVAAQTIREWADNGKLPAQRTGSGARIFSRDDVDRVKADRAAATVETRSKA